MKKILFVVDDQKMGGVSIVLREILIKLNKDNKIDLLILNNEGSSLTGIDKINYIYGTDFFKVVNKGLKEVIKSKNIISILKKINLIFLIKTGLIKNKIRKERSKIIKDTYDTEIAYKDGFCTIFTACGESSKKITFIHTDYSNNDPSKNYKSIYNESISNLDLVVPISEDIKEKFEKKYKAKDILVINNYMDSEKIIKNSKRENITYNSNIELITVGRFHPVKGYERLINVLGKLKKEKLLTNVHLTMVGDGDEKEIYENKIKEFNLEENITLVGMKTNPYPYIKSSDLLLLTSYSEGYPLTVMESLVLEVPVLAMRYSSVDEMLTNQNALIIQNDENSLYESLKKVVQDKNIIIKLKENIKNSQKENVDIIKSIEEIF